MIARELTITLCAALLIACRSEQPKAAPAPVAAPVPSSCEAIVHEYADKIQKTPCASADDCKDARVGGLDCAVGPYRIHAQTREGAEVDRLAEDFQRRHCEALPCTPPGLPVKTQCHRGACVNTQ